MNFKVKERSIDEKDIFRLESCRNDCWSRVHLVCRWCGSGDRGLAPLNDQLEQVVAAEENAGVKTSGADSRQKDVEPSGAGTDSKTAAKSTQAGQIEPASNAKDSMSDQDQGAAGSGIADHIAPSSASGQPSSPLVPPQAEGVSQQLQQKLLLTVQRSHQRLRIHPD